MSYSEIAPGLRHWTARHPGIDMEVSSYALVDEGVLLNPQLPGGDRSVLDGVELKAIVLTNRHHVRDAQQLAGPDVPIHAPAAGLHDLVGIDPPARGYTDGDELPGGLRAIEIGALSPDEFAIHLPAHDALAVADGVMRSGDGELGAFPDTLLGDDPEAVKRGLGQAYGRVCAQTPFSHLLLAHGLPVSGDGHSRLQQYADDLAATPG